MKYIKMTPESIDEILAGVKQTLMSSKNLGAKVTYTLNTGAQPEGVAKKARIIVSYEAYMKINALIKTCSKEVGWHGLVTRVEPGEGNEDEVWFELYDIIVFPQTVTGASVTPDATEYALWLQSQPDEVFNDIRFHGHSHVNMGTTPSGTDTTYQDQLLDQVKDFYIFGIFNKKGAKNLVVYDVETNVLYENKDIIWECPTIEEHLIWAEGVVELLVKEHKPKAKQTTWKDYAKPYGSFQEEGYNGWYGGGSYYDNLPRKWNNELKCWEYTEEDLKDVK